MPNVFPGRRWPAWFRSVLSGVGVAFLASCGSDTPGDPTDPSGVAIEVSSYAFVLPPTSQKVLTGTVTGTDINAPIHWVTSAASVATVADDGPWGVITGVAEGTATIYATLASNPSIRSGPVTVTVQRVPAMTAFSVDTAAQQLIVGDSKSFALRPVLAESRASVSYAFVSSNTAVATVNPSTGVITGTGPGVATITATATASGTGFVSTTLSATTQAYIATIQPHIRTSITAGRNSTCVLKLSGQAFCWGWNVNGQLGDGTKTDRFAPTAVVGGLNFTEIAQGYWHGCAIAVDSKAYCWGAGGNGRLGTADTVTRLSPAAVAGNMLFSSIDAGGVHSCGITTTNNAYCWGYNRDAELGDGTGQERWIPTAVNAPGQTFSSISLGHESTCALRSDLKMYCFYGTGVLDEQGGAIVPQMANGGVGRCILSPRGQVSCWHPFNTPRTDLHPYLDGFVFKSIALSDKAFLCGITPANDAYCWGAGESGQIGDGSSTGRVLPGLVAGGLKWKEISLGEAHACGITVSDVVYCWGSNSNGQLGTTGGNSFVPKLVPFTR